MLTEHFKLGVQPFGVTPDASFLYLSKTHREALASLFYGIQSERGFTALIALPGMGKTTLLFHLLRLLMANAKTAFLFQTLCGPEEFLRALLADLGIDNRGDMTSMHASLNAYLLQESRNGRQVVVVIDEAQNLDDRVLELVRMLSNFETPGKKLMHIVLSGQPQLAAKLSSPHLTQFRQRISIVARLAPLNEEEVGEYVEHRLRVAGSNGAIFSKEALQMIAENSCGIPRNINNLCFNSMSLACAMKRSEIDASIVREVINDLDLESLALRSENRCAEETTHLPDVELVSSNRPKSHSRRVVMIGLVIAAGVTSFAGYASFGRQFRPWSRTVTNSLGQRADDTSHLRRADLILAPAENVSQAHVASLPDRHMHDVGPIIMDRLGKANARVRDIEVLGPLLEFPPLPKDFEHLRGLRAFQFVTSNFVPFEPGKQGEKP